MDYDDPIGWSTREAHCAFVGTSRAQLFLMYSLRSIVPSAIDSSHSCLEYSCAGELSVPVTSERHRVDDVPRNSQALALRYFDKAIIKLHEMLPRTRFLANLEKLDAKLVWFCILMVELPGGVDDGSFKIIGWHTISDDDDVHGLDTIVEHESLEIGLENLVQALTGRCCTPGTHCLKDLDDGTRRCDVLVNARIGVVEEVDVDSVCITLGADRCNHFKSLASLLPRAAGHGSRIIDEKDCIEASKEVIGIVFFDIGSRGWVYCGGILSWAWCIRRRGIAVRTKGIHA